MSAQSDADLSNLLDITVSCSNLKNKDTFSKSDPMCVLFIRDNPSSPFFEVGRTERVENNLNPSFNTPFRLTYFFERRQELRFEVYDCDSHSSSLDQHDKLGYLEISLAEVVQGRIATQGKMLTDSGNTRAKIFIRAQQSVACTESYNLSFCGRGLDNKDFFSKSDPYLVFYKKTSKGDFFATGQTNVVNNNLNPNWKPHVVNKATFNDNNDQLPIKIECYDFDDDGKHDFIGDFTVTSAELFKDVGTKTFPLINAKKKEKKGKKYDNSGVIHLSGFAIEEDCDFIYYVQAGLQISFIVSIDFTASNGNPTNPNSLHFFNPQYPFNQYTTAIQAVGNIIQEYDSDKLFPVYGFGGRFFGQMAISHNWPLNNNPDNPNVCGVQGIMDAYRYGLSRSQLAGPTYFAPTVRAAMKTASEYQTGLHYFMLLIITDGAITDLEETIEAIVEASYYPLSIIIIGVGNADFESMEALDSDQSVLRYGNRVAARDIVQFVALREVLGQNVNPNQLSNKHQDILARHVLAEVPRQVKNYMKPRGVYPSTVRKLAEAENAKMAAAMRAQQQYQQQMQQQQPFQSQPGQQPSHVDEQVVIQEQRQPPPPATINQQGGPPVPQYGATGGDAGNVF